MPLNRALVRGLRNGQGGAMTDAPRITETPEPPYVAVIFTSIRTGGDDGYSAAAEEMAALAPGQPGYLGHESARDGIGITVAYWRDEESARAWKQHAAHLVVQKRGRESWYRDYRVRIATVTRDYDMRNSELA
jgi:heme-degrading monooxygenase HmoA